MLLHMQSINLKTILTLTHIAYFEGRSCLYKGRVWRVKVATPSYLHLVSFDEGESKLFVPYWEVSFV